MSSHCPWWQESTFLRYSWAAAAKSLPSCPILCDPLDGSPPGSPRILQARALECVAISFSNAWKWKLKVKSLSYVWPSATPWTAAFQAPPSMGFSRQEYWSGVPLPSLQTHFEERVKNQSNSPSFCIQMTSFEALQAYRFLFEWSAQCFIVVILGHFGLLV